VLRRGGLNATSAGIHSYLARVPEIRAIFFARGPHVPRGELRRVRSIDVAPTVSGLLGIAPPKDAEGVDLFGSR
jgi:arylsulfatase A-like enzyme